LSKITPALDKLEAIGKEIKEKHSKLDNSKGSNEMHRFLEFANSVDYILSLYSNLTQGEKFYKDLDRKLSELTGYIEDYLVARKCEMEMMLNDVTHSTATNSVTPVLQTTVSHIPSPAPLGMEGYGYGMYPGQNMAPGNYMTPQPPGMGMGMGNNSQQGYGFPGQYGAPFMGYPQQNMNYGASIGGNFGAYGSSYPPRS
jgi:ALIX V-shaped domain binding to HIV